MYSIKNISTASSTSLSLMSPVKGNSCASMADCTSPAASSSEATNTASFVEIDAVALQLLLHASQVTRNAILQDTRCWR